MTEGQRPGSRSERHQRKGLRGRKGVSTSATAAPVSASRPPVIEPLRPEPARSARRAHERGSRRRMRIIVALLLVLAAVAAAVVYALTRDDDPRPPAATPEPVRTQRTLLLQIPGPTGDAIGSALLVTDPASGDGAVVLMPSRVLSQVPGYGSAVFGEALKFGGPELSRDTLANQLGVIVDDTWVLSQEGLAAVIDAVGGVDVEVDVDLPGGKDSSDVVLRAGQQQLGGQAAAAFATYGVPDQPELGRLNRLQVVLQGLFDKVGASDADVASMLPPTNGATPATVAESLRLLAKARLAEMLSYKVVPVTDIDNGSDAETTRVDTDQLALLVDGELAASVPASQFRPDNRVVVRNGGSTAGVGQSVTRRLNAAGFTVVQTGNADNQDYLRSQVLIFDSGDRAVSAGEAVAAALGLPADSVEVSDAEQSVAEVIVTVGADYSASPASSVPASISPSVGS